MSELNYFEPLLPPQRPLHCFAFMPRRCSDGQRMISCHHIASVVKWHSVPHKSTAGLPTDILGMSFVPSNLKGHRRHHMKHQRTRYQTGSLTIEARKNGPAVWVFRWREPGANGLSVKRKQRVGTQREYPTKTAALRAGDAFQIDVNNPSSSQPSQTRTLGDMAAHYKTTELDAIGATKSPRTKEVYEHQIGNIILPRWGTQRLCDVKPVAIERWLRELEYADGSKAKIKSVFSILFQHAMRHEWASSNPVRLARQGSLSTVEPIVLTAVEISALLQELRNPFHAIVHAAAITGLRRGELFGLKWQDVSFEAGQITIARSLVDQVEGPPKTLASRRPIPMAAELAETFKTWMTQSQFAGPSDWVFASTQALGKKPLA